MSASQKQMKTLKMIKNKIIIILNLKENNKIKKWCRTNF